MAAMRTSSSRTWAARPAEGRALPATRRGVTHDLVRNATVRGAAWARPTVRGSVTMLRAVRSGEAMTRTYPAPVPCWVIPRPDAACGLRRFPDIGDPLEVHE